MDTRSDVYVLSNSCRKSSNDSDDYYCEYTPGMFIHLFLYIDGMVFPCECKAEIWVTKGLLDKAKGNILGMEIIKNQSGNTLRGSQSRVHNGKLVQTLLEGHSILSLEGSLSGDCDVEKNDKPDTWECNLNPTKVFTVSSIRWNIESYTLVSIEDNIRWNRFLPIKVNINTWRLYLDWLPTRHNLDARGIEVHSNRCAICDMDFETTHHLFVDCALAVKLWELIAVWWGFSDAPKSVDSILKCRIQLT
ncbi:hypothetical protein CTI12_AA092330 [Artemisia annua]|uniref:Reverse transcriptase zinc-binding domain-containing protein n=1 Tax=Artemisia annua TaxID=35608 RepID=A0A2U1PZS7_ARTAN|nr:hypothetical protein CTI12_AA092330 [Artemisia annua]